ncbi:MAG: hypothetical protein M1348_01770 [Candidatus Parvarchaeota archaeon]|jgi:hypothetical protein|nr:hypothetical protein [Candidatus Parvarchaeota archaeon]MCL5101319.1 hypothetical protein [Candidatus Parvarchaeota archaeon]
MRRGQATLELIIGYSMAFMVIAIALALLFLLYPQVFSTTPSSTYSGFQGLKIVGQGYLKSAGIYYLSFQNLLNENINVTNIFFLEGAINQSGFVCTTDYLPNLGSSECNLSISLVSPFSATVQIYYTPSNTSMHPHIQITGTVTG